MDQSRESNALTRPLLSSNTDDVRDNIMETVFVSNGHRFTQQYVESVQILHYKSIPYDAMRGNDNGSPTRLFHQPDAQLVFNFCPVSTHHEGSAIRRSVVSCKSASARLAVA